MNNNPEGGKQTSTVNVKGSFNLIVTKLTKEFLTEKYNEYEKY